MRGPMLLIVGGLVLLAALAGGGLALLSYLETRGAAAEVEGWADAVRNAGYEVSLGKIAVTDKVATIAEVKIGVRDDALSWRWTVPQLLVLRGEGGRFALKLDGAQTLSFQAAGKEHSFKLAAKGMEVELQRSSAGRIERVGAVLSGVSLAGPGPGDPIGATRIQVQLARADGAGPIPAGSTASLQIEKLVLPAQQNGVLGKTVETVGADLAFERGLPGPKLGTELAAWQAAADGRLKLSKLKLVWGTLQLDAEGTLRLDAEMRPAGRLEARLRNFIVALDAFHVARPLDAALRADYYAALIEEMGKGGGEASPFTLLLRDGTVALTREGGERGAALGELPLGSLPPLLPAARRAN